MSAEPFTPPAIGPAVVFTARGVPIPKGSTKAFVPKGWKRPIITSDNAKSKPWQEDVLNAAVEAMGTRPPFEGPVALRLAFFLPRPASAPRRVIYPVKKPDLDKLVRCVKDAMTRAGVYRDDSQVIEISTSKAFAAGAFDPDRERGIPRVVVRAEPIETR